MRFHILGLPHTVSSKEFLACAYTQKVVKFAKMMTDRGHQVIHYGHQESDLQCTEHVTVLTTEDWKKTYGDYDWRKHFFKFNVCDHAYQTFYANAIVEVGKRKQPLDFILPFWGSGVRPVCDAHPDMICVEPGIGYAGGHWARFKIFESYAIYHAFCGMTAVGTCKQDWYEAVIPNYFDVDDFEFCDKADKGDEHGEYFLFLGRVTEGKGVHIAIQVTEAIGARLIIAGQSSLKDNGYATVPAHVTEFGYANVADRKRLMSRAKAAFVCSMYVEPFGGVQVECLFSGTPTITTDWGSFTENNIHGVTGYRCRTMEQFIWAAKNIDAISPAACRQFALQNFCLDKVATMYDEYFQAVMNIHTGKGWYADKPDRKDLSWLAKCYPAPAASEAVESPEVAAAALTAEQGPFAARLAAWFKVLDAYSVLSVGCTPGSVYTAALEEVYIRTRTLTVDALLAENKPMPTEDIILVLETANTLDPVHNDALLARLRAHMNDRTLLIWTAARPGEGGPRQVNCHPKETWLKRFAAAGFAHNTAIQRAIEHFCRAGCFMGWFLNNVLVFSRGSDPAPDKETPAE
jgi:glycosyltransferase involved in cell wall biosynthesis